MALVLVIDDSAFQRGVIHSLVRDAGYETEEAENGRAGLEKIAARKPDCILTDLLMPDMGGLELLESLREPGAAIPVIIITGNIQESVRQRCLELGAAAVVNNGWGLLELKQVSANLEEIFVKLVKHEGGE